MRARHTAAMHRDKTLRLTDCLLWVALVGMVSGCGGPRLEPLTATSRILAFGDSLTAGVGASAATSYPAVLAQLSDIDVINSGVSGETTEEGLERLPAELDRTRPDLLLLIEGGNDILQNRSTEKTKVNLEKMIALAKERDVAVVLIGVPEKSLFSRSAAFYAEVADDAQVVFDGSLIASLLRKPSYKSDLVHLNETGYRKMAESIYELLVDNGAL